MGLDMYVFTCSEKDAGVNVVDLKRYNDEGTTKLFETEEIYYWRKFNALHGWMEDLYREKGGLDVDFNCNTVRLTETDLRRLAQDAFNGQLQPREGFFFGSQDIYPEDLESIHEFIHKARQALAEGKAVYYDSWW